MSISKQAAHTPNTVPKNKKKMMGKYKFSLASESSLSLFAAAENSSLISTEKSCYIIAFFACLLAFHSDLTFSACLFVCATLYFALLL